MKRLCVLALLLLGLVACGQTGDLYLPDEPVISTPSPAGIETDGEDEQDGSKKDTP